MKVFLVERTDDDLSWNEDYSIVVVAEDERHAEMRARISSPDFETRKGIKVTEIDLNEERCVLTANTGG